MQTVKQKTIPEYSVLRVLGTLFVVFGHATTDRFTTRMFGLRSTVVFSGALAGAFAEVSEYFYTFHMPLFFILAGALLNYTGAADRSFEDIIQKRFRRLVVPYIGYLLLYSLPIKLLTGIYNLPTAAYITSRMFETTEFSGHLWFLYRLFVVTVFLWLIGRYILRNRPWVGGGIVLCALFLCVNIPVSAVLTIPSRMLLYGFIGYLFEYVRPWLSAWIRRFWYGSLAAVIAYFAWIFCGGGLRIPAFGAQNAYLGAVQDTLASVLPASLTVFVWYAAACLLTMIKPVYENAFVRSVDKYSIYIYILHDPLNYILTAALPLLPGFSATPLQSAAVIAVRFIGLFLAAWALSPAAERLGKNRRLVCAAMLLCGALFAAANAWVYAANLQL